jgi:DNA-binding PadR family transcriptional regulator
MTDEASKFESEMNRGFLQVLALVLLEKSMYGYMMLKHLERMGYGVEENTLYPLLRRLEKPKKFYIISKKGRGVRGELLRIWKEQNEILNQLLEANKNA